MASPDIHNAGFARNAGHCVRAVRHRGRRRGDRDDQGRWVRRRLDDPAQGGGDAAHGRTHRVGAADRRGERHQARRRPAARRQHRLARHQEPAGDGAGPHRGARREPDLRRRRQRAPPRSRWARWGWGACSCTAGRRRAERSPPTSTPRSARAPPTRRSTLGGARRAGQPRVRRRHDAVERRVHAAGGVLAAAPHLPRGGVHPAAHAVRRRRSRQGAPSSRASRSSSRSAPSARSGRRGRRRAPRSPPRCSASFGDARTHPAGEDGPRQPAQGCCARSRRRASGPGGVGRRAERVENSGCAPSSSSRAASARLPVASQRASWRAERTPNTRDLSDGDRAPRRLPRPTDTDINPHTAGLGNIPGASIGQCCEAC